MKTKSSKDYLKKRLKKKSFANAYNETELLTKIGVVIARARERAGLSQMQFAKLLKTTQSVISRIENGNQNLSLKMMADIAHVLKCKLSLQIDGDRIAA